MPKQDRYGRYVTGFPFGKFEDYYAVSAARGESVGSQLPGRENDPADAYRHILWAAELTRRFGEEKARKILDAHEEMGSSATLNRPADRQSPEAEGMDRANNEIGIRIGKVACNWPEVIAESQKVMDRSDRDGKGAGGGAMWHAENEWRKNPLHRVTKEPIPTDKTNWPRTNWKDGQVPEDYSYPWQTPHHRHQSHPWLSNDDMPKAREEMDKDVWRPRSVPPPASPAAGFGRTLFGTERPDDVVGLAMPRPQPGRSPEPDPNSGEDRRTEGRTPDLWQQSERDKPKAELVAPAEKPEPPPPGVFTTVPWPRGDQDEDTSLGMFFHKGGAVPADGDPRTESRKAIVQEGEFVLAPATTQAVDPDLVAAMNAMAAASPEKARKLREALAAILGDGPALSEETLKNRLASERNYWRSGPEGDAKRWWYATEYRFAFPDDQDGRTDRADGGLVSDGDRARRRADLPADLPEGGFVLSRQAVRAFGANLLGRLNAAGLVENAQALTEVRRAIAQAMSRRLKLKPDELRAMQMDPRSWRDLDREYIDRIADEYRFALGG